MEKRPCVDKLDSFYHLVADKKSGFKVKFFPASIKKLL